MNLPPPLAVALQTGFNNYLSLDIDTQARMQSLSGKLIRLQLTGVNLGAWFLFYRDHVEILEQFDGDADATISGGPVSLLALSQGRRSIFDGEVAISGDVELARQFSRMLEQVDIDWAEHLSRVTGDTVAHQLDRTFSKVREWLCRTHHSMRENTADYLRDEANHVPHDWELEEFCNQVDDLRDQVDQLEDRIRRSQKSAVDTNSVRDLPSSRRSS